MTSQGSRLLPTRAGIAKRLVQITRQIHLVPRFSGQGRLPERRSTAVCVCLLVTRPEPCRPEQRLRQAGVPGTADFGARGEVSLEGTPMRQLAPTPSEAIVFGLRLPSFSNTSKCGKRSVNALSRRDGPVEVSISLSEWRPRPELNRGARFCRPLRNHSATWPSACMYHAPFAGCNSGGGAGLRPLRRLATVRADGKNWPAGCGLDMVRPAVTSGPDR